MPSKEELLLLLEKHRYFLLLGLLGIFFIGTGIFITRAEFFSKPKFEVLTGETLGTNSTKLYVEISGAVEKPGVYTFDSNSRVDNLLVMAGGLSSKADREWVDKNINRAAILKDGQKLYIPRTDEVENTDSGLKIYESDANISNLTGQVNINTASLAQLDKLEGIGQVRAQKIIDNRPYTSIDELVSKKVLTKNIFEGIKDKLTAP
jgi:competence protein ComEA